MEEEMKKRFETVRALMLYYRGMYGFLESDYGKGVQQGIASALRALELEKDFEAYLKELKDGKDTSVLSDRME